MSGQGQVGSLKVGEQVGFTPTSAPSGGGRLQFQEFLLLGSVAESGWAALSERLRGICDPGAVGFYEHELTFHLRTNNPAIQPTTLRCRRRLDGEPPEATLWHIQYLGTADPELSKTLPALVRKRIDSQLTSRDMMGFLRGLGFRMTYEYVTKGMAFTKGNLKITVAEILKPQTAGQTNKGLERVTESRLVELSCVVPMGTEEPAVVARTLADFAAQLSPIVQLSKPDFSHPQM